MSIVDLEMILQIIKFLKAYIRGEEATLDLSIEFTWLEVVVTVLLFVLVIRLLLLL